MSRDGGDIKDELTEKQQEAREERMVALEKVGQILGKIGWSLRNDDDPYVIEAVAYLGTAQVLLGAARFRLGQ